jgi:hypothetical protein
MSKNATETRGPGRPAKSVKFPTGTFTVATLVANNPGVCKLTLRKNVKSGLASGKLVKVAKTLATGKAGRPSYQFSLATTYNARMANLAKANAKNAAPAPVTPTESVPVTA